MSLTIKGATSGSVDVVAPASGSDVTLTLPTTTATVETTASSIASSRLTGALPAVSGALLTNLPAGGVDGIVSTANATAITIDSSENVGIGTTTPDFQLISFVIILMIFGALKNFENPEIFQKNPSDGPWGKRLGIL